MAEEMNKIKVESESNLKKYMLLEKTQIKESDTQKQIRDLKESLASANSSVKLLTEEKNKLENTTDKVRELEV